MRGKRRRSRLIESRLDAWDRGDYNALIKDIEDAAMEEGLGPAMSGEFEVESAGRRFNSMVLDRKISETVKAVTNADKGGLIPPDGHRSKIWPASDRCAAPKSPPHLSATRGTFRRT